MGVVSFVHAATVKCSHQILFVDKHRWARSTSQCAWSWPAGMEMVYIYRRSLAHSWCVKQQSSTILLRQCQEEDEETPVSVLVYLNLW